MGESARLWILGVAMIVALVAQEAARLDLFFVLDTKRPRPAKTHTAAPRVSNEWHSGRERLGWSQLAAMRAGTKTPAGCMCADGGVMLLPENQTQARVLSYTAADSSKQITVTVAGQRRTVHRAVLARISVPGSNGRTREIIARDETAVCIQECATSAGFLSFVGWGEV